jgi:AcrR family transcriptional regulator
MNIHSVTARTDTRSDSLELEKRDAILDAALALFAERTFDGTPVPLIADRAGVGAGTIYRYFADKHALVNALYQRWKRAMAAAIVPAQPIDDAREEFHHWWDGLWRFASAHPDAFAFLETHHHQPYLDDASREAGRALDVAAVRFARRAQASGAMRKAKPEMLTALVLGAFTGLVKAAGDGGLTYSRKEAEASEACVWAMLQA